MEKQEMEMETDTESGNGNGKWKIFHAKCSFFSSGLVTLVL